jgi:tetratricopeptide (TPR) repeat protein
MTNLQELVTRATLLKKAGNLSESLSLFSQAFDLLVAEAMAYAQSKQAIFVDEIKDPEAINPEYTAKIKEYYHKNTNACLISNNMGVIFVEMGNLETAKEMFYQAIDLTPPEVEYPDPHQSLKTIDILESQ